ncbi:hypothetical protein [Gordonia amicalis]|uniref:hypothetical protein n=1 Tax=Gordonia amicalis TaxID=89053 RepID=UPI0002A62445|nr:hypothetical protein [Gordonia amicalis]NKX77475.1 hypothetical protein [Gordonia amicalis]GAC52347.1 hypothetical protein GOAMI_09_00700 [Gordonia amicalis NBRC 100051 = JCM 11271]
MATPHPAPWPRALIAFGRCFAEVVRSLIGRRLHQPLPNLGRVVAFADGTTATVYRETRRDNHPVTEPVCLVVCFRLRWVDGNRLAHRVFRVESVCNTILFAGFDGFVSKLWMTADGDNRYRGIYDWDGYDSAVDYVSALWWPLMVVAEQDSIHYHVVGDRTRDSLLAGGGPVPDQREWWRPVRRGG